MGDSAVAHSSLPESSMRGVMSAVRVHATREVEDADLARALIARERHAPRLVWRRFRPLVFGILKRTLGPRQDTEDLAQEIFLCLFEKVSTLRDPTVLRKFIVSITVITVRGERRRQRVHRRSRSEWKADARKRAAVHVDIESREALRRFYRVLDRLSPGDRTLFIWRFIEELSLLQVAEASGLSLATIKRQLTRIFSRFRLLAERDPVLCDYLSKGVSPLDADDGAVLWPGRVVGKNQVSGRFEQTPLADLPRGVAVDA